MKKVSAVLIVFILLIVILSGVYVYLNDGISGSAISPTSGKVYGKELLQSYGSTLTTVYIALDDKTTGQKRSTTTDLSGNYQFANLPLGHNYHISVGVQGPCYATWNPMLNGGYFKLTTTEPTKNVNFPVRQWAWIDGYVLEEVPNPVDPSSKSYVGFAGKIITIEKWDTSGAPYYSFWKEVYNTETDSLAKFSTLCNLAPNIKYRITAVTGFFNVKSTDPFTLTLPALTGQKFILKK